MMRLHLETASQKQGERATTRLWSRALMGAASVVVFCQVLDAAPAMAVDEIVVTAERRESKLSKTPLAIDVLSGDNLIERNIQNSSDLQFATPSLVLSGNSVQSQLYVRGIGSENASPAADPGVAFHIDGVYYPRPANAFQELFDIERVELVKGPQGTLYGRNATGGAINVITREPTGEFELSADVLYGSYNKLRMRGLINGPLGDNVAGRLSVMRSTADGYVTDLESGNDVDYEDSMSARGALLFKGDSSLEVLVRADYSLQDDGRTTATKLVSTSAPAISLGADVPADFYSVRYNVENPFLQLEQYGGSAKVTFDVNNVGFTSLTSYRESEYEVCLDSDSTEVAIFSLCPQIQESQAFSQEFQLNYDNGGAISWVGGLFFFHEDAYQSSNIVTSTSTIFRPADATTDAYAAFGELRYAFNEQLSATLGGRFSFEQRELEFSSFVNGFLAGSVFNGRDQWNAFTPKFGLEFFPNDNTMIYGSVRRGFKSGSFNTLTTLAPEEIRPEFVWAYEAGVKASLWDRLATIDLAAFYYDYKDLQTRVFVTSSTPVTTNAAEATPYGVDLSGTLQPTDALQFSASVSYLKAEYDDYTTIDPFTTASVQLAGNTLVRAPEFSGNMSALYTHHLNSGSTLSARVEYFYRDKTYFDPFNNEIAAQDGFGLLNASIVFEDESKAYNIRLYGQNLTDEEYFTNMANTTSTGAFGWQGEPTRFGIQLGVKL